MISRSSKPARGYGGGTVPRAGAARLVLGLVVLMLLLWGCVSPPVKTPQRLSQAPHEVTVQPSLPHPRIWPAAAMLMMAKGAKLAAANPGAARRVFERALLKYPDLEPAYYNLSLLAYRAGRHPVFARVLQRAKKARAISARLYNLAGVWARAQGHFDAAENYYKQALAQDPLHPSSLLNMAILVDIYRHDLIRARGFYLRYRDALKRLGRRDKRIKNWLADLQQRLKAEAK